MAAKPPRPRGARAGRVVFGSAGLVGSAAIVLAMGPIWAPSPVSTEVVATPMRVVENAEILAATDATSVTPPTTAPPAPTSLPPEPELIIVEVHRRVPAGTPTPSDATTSMVSDPGSPATRSPAAVPVAGTPPAAASAPTQSPARPAAPTPAAAPAPAAPAPAPTPQAAPPPAPPPPPPAPTAPPRTSSSG